MLAPKAERHFDVFFRIEPVDQVEALKDDADLGPVGGKQMLLPSIVRSDLGSGRGRSQRGEVLRRERTRSSCRAARAKDTMTRGRRTLRLTS